MALTLGEDQDHLEPGGIAHMLEQDRRPFGLLEPLIGGLDAFGFAVGRPCCDRGLGTRLRYCHGTALLSVSICLITRQKLPTACSDPYRRKRPRIGHGPSSCRRPDSARISSRNGCTTKLNPSMCLPMDWGMDDRDPSTTRSRHCANVSQRGWLSTS